MNNTLLIFREKPDEYFDVIVTFIEDKEKEGFKI